MFAFIRKRLPSKERNNEHQMVKSEEKKKTNSSSTIGELVVGPSTSLKINQINQPYSDMDYFPMRSGGLTETVKDDKLTSSHDSFSDSYYNPAENIAAKSEEQRVQPTVIKPRIIEIPITFIPNDSEATNHKRS